MKRAVILLAAAALSLGGCSGKAKDGKDAAADSAAGKPEAGPAKPNPWNSTSAADSAAGPAVPDNQAAAKPEAKPTSNPWAKNPPAGSLPSSDPAAVTDEAKK